MSRIYLTTRLLSPGQTATRVALLPVLLGTGLVFSSVSLTPTHAQSPASAPTAALPASVPNAEARTTATHDLLRRASAAIEAKDLREAVELYRRAKVNAQPLPDLQPKVVELRQRLKTIGFDDIVLDMPPSAPPAAAAGSAAATPQPTPIQVTDGAIPLGDVAVRKANALRLIATGRAALDRGDIVAAQQAVAQAESLSVPESAFQQGEQRVWQLALDVDAAARRAGIAKASTPYKPGQAPSGQASPNQVVQAGAVMPAGDIPVQGNAVVPSVFNSGGEKSPIQLTQAAMPIPSTSGEGEKLYREGLNALSTGDSSKARELFIEAWKYEASMDLATRNQLKEKLTLMQPTRMPAADAPVAPENLTPIQKAELEAQTEARRVYREVTAELAAVNNIQATKPMDALDRLIQLRKKVQTSKLDAATTNSLQTMVDRAITAQESYVEANRAKIDLELANTAVEAKMADESATRQKNDDEIAGLVETYNDLMKKRQYMEAEVIAKKVAELRPGSTIATQLTHGSRMAVRNMMYEDIASAKEDHFAKNLLAIDEAGIAMDPSRDYLMPDARDWTDLSTRRLEASQADSRLSPAEKDIKRRLSTLVDINYTNRPLSEVLQDLAAVTNIPIVMDNRAMAELRVPSDAPVTLELSKSISLQSALNLILSNYDLTYVIRNEVLNITSLEAKRSMVYAKTYRVTDLVTPIPNFATTYEDGLAGALRAAHQMTVQQPEVQLMPVSMAGLANQQASMGPQATNPNMMAQYGNSGSGSMFGNGGPNGMPRGGASFADFTQLINLIQTTIEPDSWEALGGTGTIQQYPQNLSLVISTTSEIHDQITELLESLRRLQNLQVTIEVRFITLSDNFFERIGVDFDVSFDDNVKSLPADDSGPAVTVGFDGITGLPTSDFDIKFQQNVGGVNPTLTGFDPNSGARIGFAILSDIEAFFFLQATQSDARNNVLQAPKITLFDGQIGTIFDGFSRPFVTSIVPVVGDFAVAQQPVIVVLNEGTQLNVQAVVSDDKRFVRLTLVPLFSQIGNVDTFTFEGRRRRTTTSTQTDPTTGRPMQNDQDQDIVEGTTVQLPTLASTSVSTTVSVPDGGTILLGGVKRLSEQRNERGIPILSKIPYVSRLFRNVAVGRTASSLMLMVTPRIIIQEEEELAQTGFDPNR